MPFRRSYSLSQNSQSPIDLVFPSRRGGYRRYSNWRRDVWNPACEISGVSARPMIFGGRAHGS
jgi:hypothetical protein